MDEEYAQDAKAFLASRKRGRGCDWCDILDSRVLMFWHIGERWMKPQMVQYINECVLFCQNCLHLSLLQEQENRQVSPLPTRLYWRMRHNKAFTDSYKRAHGCVRCGLRDPRVLEFHHLDPVTKRGSIGSKLPTWTLREIKQEIAKCEVLCANCHFLEHLGEEGEIDIEEIVRRLNWTSTLEEGANYE